MGRANKRRRVELDPARRHARQLAHRQRLKGTRFEEEVYFARGERWTIGNLAAQAGGPIIELIEFRRMLAEGIRPDFVLIEVTTWFLSEPVLEAFAIKSARLNLSDFESLDQCDLPTRDALRAAGGRNGLRRGMPIVSRF